MLPLGKNFLLSASSDKTVAMWDLRNSPPQLHYVFKGHADPVNAMCLIGTALFSVFNQCALMASLLIGTDLIAAAGYKLSLEGLLRDDPPGSTIKMETYRLQNNKSNITTLEVLPYHQLLVAGTEDGSVKLFR